MKHVLMIAYTDYKSDARVRREAETVASLPDYDVTVLSARENEKPQVFESRGVRVRELGIAKYRGNSKAIYIVSYLFFTFLAFIECTKLSARKSLDVLHVHNMPNFIVFAGLIPLLSGKPIILDIHDTMVENYAATFSGRSGRILEWGLQIEEAVCCRMASRIICVNDVQKTVLVQRNIPESKIVVAMNVPDPKIFDHNGSIQDRQKEAGKFRMIFYGTVTKRVGIDRAIRVISQLGDRIPGLEFHIVGEGDDMDRIREQGKRLEEEGKVYFRGSVPQEELIPILACMDLLIIPNERNTATELMLPVKMLECIALGIPVVAPRLKAITHYFTEDMVFYFDPENIVSMEDAIYKASTSGAARLSKATKAREFLDEYGWESHKIEFIEIYRDLANECRHPFLFRERNRTCPSKRKGS